MDEESTVETAYSVWGSDEESELDKGVGGLDPAHHDSKHVNGQENARERLALIVIDNKGEFGANGTASATSCFLSTASSATRFFLAVASSFFPSASYTANRFLSTASLMARLSRHPVPRPALRRCQSRRLS